MQMSSDRGVLCEEEQVPPRSQILTTSCPDPGSQSPGNLWAKDSSWGLLIRVVWGSAGDLFGLRMLKRRAAPPGYPPSAPSLFLKTLISLPVLNPGYSVQENGVLPPKKTPDFSSHHQSGIFCGGKWGLPSRKLPVSLPLFNPGYFVQENGVLPPKKPPDFSSYRQSGIFHVGK